MSGLRVVRPGLFTTIQDLGRPGHRGLGVPGGGAFDVASFRLANALAGNAPGAPALEMTLLGGTYEALGPIVVALAGAPMEARVEPARGASRPVRPPSAFGMGPGDRLVLGGTPFGARTYLAAHGGIDAERILGSASREAPLSATDVLTAPAATGPTFWPGAGEGSLSPLRGRARREGPEDRDSRDEPTTDGPATSTTPPARLRVVVGPDDGPWPDAGLRVGSLADRLGVRLEAPIPPGGEPPEPDRLSTPVAPGAIQWTGAGWIALGVAGGTMGGYPVVAQVIRADLDVLGQLRPGDRVALERVTLEQAIDAVRRRRADLDRRDKRLRLAALGLIRPLDARS